MKTKYKLLLAAAAVLPLSALAQSGVQLSGIIDTGLRRDSGGTGKWTMGSGHTTGSRLTFSGAEDLGGGLQASFVLEAGLAIDTGLGTSNPPGAAAGALTFGRTSLVAIGSNDMGFVSLGRQYTPMWLLDAGGISDPFGGSWLGGQNVVISNTVRASNAITYAYGYTNKTTLLPAPRTGLGVNLMYAFPEAPAGSPTQSGQQLGFNVSYGAGPWWGGYAFHQTRGNNPTINATAPVTDQPRLRQQVAVGSYDFGFARVHAGIGLGKNDAATTGKLDRRSWYVGATVPVGQNQFIRALYGKANERSGPNLDFDTFQIGYQYFLSKRTQLYAAWGKVDNDPRSAATLLASYGTYGAGSTPRSFFAGVRHDF